MDAKYFLSEQYSKLKEAIFEIILNNGMKKTTMDLVASTLSMSKRTLYEIFDNKEQMIKVVLDFNHKRHIASIAKVFKESQTVMEAFYIIIKMHQDVMKRASSHFFCDMDRKYSKMRPVYDGQNDVWLHNMLDAIKKGIEQGVFRKDVNYPVSVRMFRIQMESLKRMEEFLPSTVTIQEAYDAICVGFLRSIASPLGMGILDDTIKKYASPAKEIN
ncbi:MAG: TetR/AcrR family transcriptional regulator [Muribaculaceae bacterium]|nr:TetR/AcrR family transcriptional regulator [Muribaculaceae bacterium]